MSVYTTLLSGLLFITTITSMSIPQEKQEKSVAEDAALYYLVRAPKKASANPKALVLLHGVGSNEDDLFGLATYLPDDFYVISARGPITQAMGRYAWYQVDFSSGRPVYNETQEHTSREAIIKLLAQVKEKYHLEQIYLGGFSQGAIMSYSVGLTHPHEVTGVIAFSGRMLEEIQKSVETSAALQHVKVFMAHGRQDNVLPIHYAHEAQATLKKLQIPVSYHEYDMGHQIIGPVLTDLNVWLQQPE